MSQGGIISLSPAGQIGGEHCVSRTQLASLNAALQADADHHVTVVAASGDAGAAGEPCALITALFGIGTFPPPVKELGLVASDPLVLSVGGTTLHASHTTGAYLSETAWGLPYGTPGTWVQASGGGFSHLLTPPAYQDLRPRTGPLAPPRLARSRAGKHTPAPPPPKPIVCRGAARGGSPALGGGRPGLEVRAPRSARPAPPPPPGPGAGGCLGPPRRETPARR